MLFPSIETLSLAGNCKTDAYVDALDCAELPVTLRRLKMDSCRLLNDDACSVVSKLRRHFEKLLLSRHEKKNASEVDSTFSLDFSGNPLSSAFDFGVKSNDDDDTHPFFLFLQQKPYVDVVGEINVNGASPLAVVDICTFVTAAPYLRTLEVEGVLDMAGVKRLLVACKRAAALRELNLKGCGIVDTNARHISNAVCEMPSLSHGGSGESGESQRSVKMKHKSLQAASKKAPVQQNGKGTRASMSIDDDETGFDQHKIHEKQILLALNLSGNGLGPSGIGSLAPCFRRLSHIDLSYTLLGDEGVTQLCTHLERAAGTVSQLKAKTKKEKQIAAAGLDSIHGTPLQLRCLMLGANNITESSLVTMCRVVLRVLPCLELFSLRGNQRLSQSPHNLKSLCALVRTHKALQRVDLGDCGFHHKHIERFIDDGLGLPLPPIEPAPNGGVRHRIMPKPTGAESSVVSPIEQKANCVLNFAPSFNRHPDWEGLSVALAASHLYHQIIF